MRSSDGRPPYLEYDIEEIFGNRRRVGVRGRLLLTVGGSGQALAQQVNNLPVVQAVVKTATPLPSGPRRRRPLICGRQPLPARRNRLQRAGWPLYALVDKFSAGAPLTDEANCIAVAVYHEARGESLEGQLAVAKVIMNRAASGKYPTSWCGVVKQPWQFSFVNPRTGHYPVGRCSFGRLAQGARRHPAGGRQCRAEVPADCLWYHADYVAPSWGRRLTKVDKIGAHIFYRA